MGMGEEARVGTGVGSLTVRPGTPSKRGSVMVTVVPFPSLLSTWMVPP